MALKFLNKKGWHTGSLRNIENVWKAEQKHDAEQKKLEELRKQIQEERERAEFRELQEQAGLVPRQERLEFLYDSGLAVGKSSGFKALESLPTKTDPPDSTAASSSAFKQPQSSAPGALFEDKPQSANDTWRKLHSDPLLLIRQREQDALARVKNNPVQMAMIKKSVEAMKQKDKTHEKDGEKLRKKHHHKKSMHHKKSKRRSSSSDEDSSDGEERGKRDRHRDRKHKDMQTRESDEDSSEGDYRGKRDEHRDRKHKDMQTRVSDLKSDRERGDYRRKSKHDSSDYGQRESGDARERREHRDFTRRDAVHSSDTAPKRESNKRRNPVRLSEEERAARLREMQLDAELHEEQRWKRLKKADENDAKEAIGAHPTGGRNFLDAAHRSIYGAEKGGSTTIEESVRRRTHYLQGRSEATERNAFRRRGRGRNGASRAPDEAVLVARLADPESGFFAVVFPTTVAVDTEEESVAPTDLARARFNKLIAKSRERGKESDEFKKRV
nr:pre-mRNA-splicing factor CWC25 homolog [Ipomoea batatas]